MYKDDIRDLITKIPLVNLDAGWKPGRIPTSATSEFLTNKEQGDWAETVVHNAINENSRDYFAVRYGRSENLSAGDDGFNAFFSKYQEELELIGKKPDLLIFKRSDLPSPNDIDLEDTETVSKAVAAIEVRSSSFLANKYDAFMEQRAAEALLECQTIKDILIQEPYRTVLNQKSPDIYAFISNSTPATFKEFDFRMRSWSTSRELIFISQKLSKLKDAIKVLHKRDYLSITPKVEDISLVYKWIKTYNVRHYYLQVFFDKAYIISFKEILQTVSDSEKEDVCFSVEQDVKNQGKTTFKINVRVGREIIGQIDMPTHHSYMKELERGRLLFYVKFENGKAFLDESILNREIINDR